MTTGICNEVSSASLKESQYGEVIVRLSPEDKFLMRTHNNIPRFKKLGIVVPEILAEDYGKTMIPYSYQVLTKLSGLDVGQVIAAMSDA